MRLFEIAIILWTVVSTDAFATHQIATKRHVCPAPLPQTSFPIQQRAPEVCFPTKSTQLNALAIDSAQEGNWKAFLDDEKTGLVFYYNVETGESVWEPPTNSFPKVQLSNWMEEKIVDVRDTYLKNLENDRLGIIGNILKPFEKFDRVSLDTSEMKATAPSSDSIPVKSWKSLFKKEQPTNMPVADVETKNTDAKPLFDSMMESISSFDIFQDKHFKEMTSVLSQKSALAKPDEVSEVTPAPGNSDNKDLEEAKADSFSLQQRIESTKAGLTGLLAGGSAIVPFNMIRGFFGDSFFSPAEAFFTSAAGGVESGLFAIVYRLCVRSGEETNEQLTNAIAGAFVVTRALSMTTGWDDGAIDVMPQIVWNGFESFVMFHVAKNAVEFMVKKGLIERME